MVYSILLGTYSRKGIAILYRIHFFIWIYFLPVTAIYLNENEMPLKFSFDNPSSLYYSLENKFDNTLL